jgi:hypothetical protein
MGARWGSGRQLCICEDDEGCNIEEPDMLITRSPSLAGKYAVVVGSNLGFGDLFEN